MSASRRMQTAVIALLFLFLHVTHANALRHRCARRYAARPLDGSV
jgi:hypothetical protein